MLALALNAGSSSLKLALFAIEQPSERLLVRGAVRRVGQEGGRIAIEDGDGRVLVEEDANCADHVEALHAALDALDRASLPRAEAVGHRLVHGGPRHRAPARVDAELRASLTELVRLAPLHLPAELAVLDATTERCPGLPQVACFDTAFHRTLPEVAERFALPRDLFD